MNTRKKLADILANADREKLGRVWDSTKAADDLKPLPNGEYRCNVASGELFNARSGTPGYKLKLVVLEGEHAGRVLWHDLWITDAALPMTKRDLGKLGITEHEQMERPLPEGIIVQAKVAFCTDDDGTEYNRVRRLNVVAIEPPEPEPFAPSSNRMAEPSPTSEEHHPPTEDRRDSFGFNWMNGKQEDPPADRRQRGAYSHP
jgi:Protein of unknown function (DUF669)